MKKKDEFVSLNRKLNKIIKNQSSLASQLKKERKEEELIEKKESSILSKEDKLLKEEHSIRKKLERKILSAVTLRDINKGIIGAFMGTIGHFAFFEGKHIAEDMSFGRATSLYVFAYLVGILFIYFSGFRKVKTERLVHLIPLRVTTMFIISIISSFVILIMFNQISFSMEFLMIYKIVANVSVLAMFGAVTADFIGE